ncbi:MAG: outer membrane lipoprotein carrier protein LolA [Prevotella sp.]|nr:outer membrane lipoprotein carrier protein LolA [Prevotella sp.]MCD8289198.1 outer membrane lipoprotein carrier protein LolA [Prevotella sp.]MCD8306458.1 outer membrane lipoprotein carrier protein LolA [Prevotella sp.]
MKRIFTLLLALLLIATGASAQQTEIRKAAKKYKAASTLTADVKLTRHNAAITKDAVSDGHFYYKKPNSLSMVFASKEMLLATGDTFTMVKGGKQSTTKANGKGNNPFEVLSDVFRNLLSSDDYSKLTDMADVKMKTQGNTCTITITPNITDPKLKRRMAYTSCTATIDLKAGELRTLRINEKGENYSQYDFSNYVFNGDVSSKVFDTKIVL